MNETRKLCDKCEKPNAKKFEIFKENLTDGAGSSETWYWTFDLCAECCSGVMTGLFMPRDKASFYADVIRGFGVKMRVE